MMMMNTTIINIIMTTTTTIATTTTTYTTSTTTFSTHSLLILPSLLTLLLVSRIRIFPILSSLFISDTTFISRPFLLTIQGFFWQRTFNSLHKIIPTFSLFVCFFFIYHIYSYCTPHTFLTNLISLL